MPLFWVGKIVEDFRRVCGLCSDRTSVEMGMTERTERGIERDRTSHPDLKNKVHFPLALQWDPLKKH